MRPPWIEAAVLLSTHGHTLNLATFRRWRPRMSDAIRFALLTDERLAKPIVFPDIDALARHIERARNGQALEFAPLEDLEIAGDSTNRPGTSVFALDAGNDRDRLIGHAWIDGRGQDVLMAAMRRARGSCGDRKAA